MTEKGLTKQRILAELSRSAHGDLSEYIPIGQQAAKEEPEFLAHLIAWDAKKGQVRDAKVALPIVSLSVPGFPDEFVENSFAHLASLDPRMLVKAYEFMGKVKLPGRRSRFDKVITTYLREKEQNFPRWERLALQHRKKMKTLYSLAHVKPSEMANICLWSRTLDKRRASYPSGSLFERVAQLKNMTDAEAAGVIIKSKIPFLVVRGVLGKRLQGTDLVLALIKSMTATEAVTATKMLERLGVKSNPVLRAAYEEKLEEVSKSKKNVLKTTRAAEQMTDEGLKKKLQDAQERQIKTFSNVEGNWVVLGDMSGSMNASIEVAKHVAAVLARMAQGKVWLIFFNTMPRALDVTGKSLDEIKQATRYVRAGGGTSIGCGLQWIMENKHEIDGITIASDGGDNTAPYFHEVYKRYSESVGKEVPVYLYQMSGDRPHIIDYMKNAQQDLHVFDVTEYSSKSVEKDYNAFVNLVSTMRTNRYSLVDEVMESKLLKLADVLPTWHVVEAVAAKA